MLFQQVSSELKKRVKKLVLVLAISMPMIVIREKVVKIAETTETTGAAEVGKNGEGGKYSRTNFSQVLYIRYPIIF